MTRHANVRRLTHWLVWLCAAALVACAQPRIVRPETILAEYEKGGYRPAERLETAEFHDVWIDPASERRIGVKAIAPAKAGTYPILAYSPGLGETTDDGALWTNAWARAGYFVLVVQPEEHDSRVWRTLAARTGDFASLARDHFSQPSLERRLADTTFALAHARALAREGDPFFRAADPERVAVAGFDLGAQTALGLAVRASLEGAGLPKLRATIALSPYGSIARPGPDEDFSAIRMPVLIATATQDLDPYGILPSPSMRRAPFQFLRGKDKFLLLLAQGGHDALAGNTPPPDVGEPRPGTYAARFGGTTEGGGPRSARTPAADDASGTPGVESARPAFDSVRTTTRIQMRDVAFVQSISTAFLDVAVKNDGVANEWFSKDARRYLGEFAQLQVR